MDDMLPHSSQEDASSQNQHRPETQDSPSIDQMGEAERLRDFRNIYRESEFGLFWLEMFRKHQETQRTQD